MNEYYLGIDFGTSYSKCLVRHENSGQVWPVWPGQEEPLKIDDLLFSSDLGVSEEGYRCLFGTALNLDSGRCLYNLKMALVSAVKEDWDSSWLRGMTQFNSSSSARAEIKRQVGALVCFYLASLLRHTFASIRQRQPGFKPFENSLIGVHLAIPVASAQEKKVTKAFESALTRALQIVVTKPNAVWSNSEEFIPIYKKVKGMKKFQKVCRIVPEVNAAIDSFLRSRSARPGVYFVVDVGAGTIDMSMFTYVPTSEIPIHFWAADVRDLGSAQIELRAMDLLEREALPYLRQLKVQGVLAARVIQLDTYAKAATTQIKEEVERAAIEILNVGITRYGGLDRNVKAMGIVHVGGGGNDDRYRKSVLDAKRKMTFEDGGLMNIPEPADIQWPFALQQESDNCFRRFTVAYGLAVNPAEIKDHQVHVKAPPPTVAVPERVFGNEYIEN